MTRAICALLLGLLAFSVSSFGAEWKKIEAVRDNILCLSFDDLVTIKWGALGGTGHDDNLVTAPLDTALAGDIASYQVSGCKVVQIGRKTRPHTFARTPGGSAHALENLIYLVLDHPLKPDSSVVVSVSKQLVTSGPASMDLTYDPARSRSSAVQANQLSYLPDAAKYAYVSAWLGDLGPQTFTVGTPFQVLDEKSRRPVFSGTLSLRKSGEEADSGRPGVGNFYRANLYECDLTKLQTPGTYVVSVSGVGCSLPFQIDAGGYREPFITMMRGVYHQRCGTELAAQYTNWSHPACHMEPLLQTDHRYMDAPFSDGPPKKKGWKTTGELRENVAGGWHDAGDWDREESHADIPSYFLLAYELTPNHYGDNESNIPESGNGLPDIIDEARWGVDYYRRLQRPNGGVSVGMFESRWPMEGEVSWTDTLKKYCYAEEPVCTFKQAAAAAHLALTLKKLGRAEEAKPYADCALRAWNWATDSNNLRPRDERKIRDDRFHAAAALYRLTGDPKYQDSFKADLMIRSKYTLLSVWGRHQQALGVWTYVMADDDLPGLDKPLREMLRAAVINAANVQGLQTSEKRGDRRGYDWYYPFTWGLGLMTNNFPLMVAHKLTHDPRYLDVMVANCDLILGNNPLNMIWITGMGPQSPRQIMQINYWYSPQGPNPGILPMGPSVYDEKLRPPEGEWDVQYAWQYVYPEASKWPPMELWFENRFCAQTNEFLVVNEALLACSFGYLRSPIPASPLVKK